MPYVCAVHNYAQAQARFLIMAKSPYLATIFNTKIAAFFVCYKLTRHRYEQQETTLRGVLTLWSGNAPVLVSGHQPNAAQPCLPRLQGGLTMEWINAIVTAVCSLLAAIGGGGIIYAKQNRAMKEVEVELKKQEGESNELHQWQDIASEKDKQIATLKGEQDKLKGDNEKLNEKISRLYEERNREYDDATFYRYALSHILSGQFYCEVHSCTARKPLHITEDELEVTLREKFGLMRFRKSKEQKEKEAHYDKE